MHRCSACHPQRINMRLLKSPGYQREDPLRPRGSSIGSSGYICRRSHGRLLHATWRSFSPSSLQTPTQGWCQNYCDKASENSAEIKTNNQWYALLHSKHIIRNVSNRGWGQIFKRKLSYWYWAWSENDSGLLNLGGHVYFAEYFWSKTHSIFQKCYLWC